MKSVKLGNVTIGKGKPKICVSLIGRTFEEVLKQASVACSSQADILEWRLDYLVGELTTEEILSQLAEIKQLTRKPLLLTFRRHEEGGERGLTLKEYRNLYEELVISPLVEAIDVELFSGEKLAKDLIEIAHANQTIVVLSNHDFTQTPSQNEISQRLKLMVEYGGDIAKMAVMPTKPRDVLTLLAATVDLQEAECSIPIVTMSMGELGKVSRISGELFGSAMTFGALEEVSAPGQLKVSTLEILLSQMGLKTED